MVLRSLKAPIRKFPKKISVINIGVDTNQFKFVDRSFKPPYKICMVGGMEPRKRIYSTIQMLADLNDKDFELTVLKGWPPDALGWYVDDCKNIADKLGVKINFVGYMDHNKVQYIFYTQDLIISNSSMEGIHNSIAEAMATGCYPLINAWSGSEDVYPFESIFKTQDGFIKKIKAWKKSKSKLELSKKSRKWVEEKYDLNKIAKKMKKEIEDSFSKKWGQKQECSKTNL